MGVLLICFCGEVSKNSFNYNCCSKDRRDEPTVNPSLDATAVISTESEKSSQIYGFRGDSSRNAERK